MGLELLSELRLVEIIGEEILDPGKARRFRRGEAVEERHLVEEHGEVGGKLRHDAVPYSAG
ncbi:hypothetical protein ABIE82_005736 [Bradyrhizobium diazoefficiens]